MERKCFRKVWSTDDTRGGDRWYFIAKALKKGGRLFLVGAGTSGRLGLLEAAEMPLTFGTSPQLVQAIMAGGQDAVIHSREGVEDNFEEGARSVARLRVSKRDVVIGVSASGITQFVRGALTGARKKGARIIFVTCWPGTELQNFVDLIIAPARDDVSAFAATRGWQPRH